MYTYSYTLEAKKQKETKTLPAPNQKQNQRPFILMARHTNMCKGSNSHKRTRKTKDHRIAKKQKKTNMNLT